MSIQLIPKIIIGLIAFIHIYIMWFEMFAWETRGPKIFRGFEKALFPKTKVMAGNQGLYNGFLAAGLIWSLLIQNEVWQNNVAIFFLGCVAVAGIYGALTAAKKIIMVQTVPALFALLAIWITA